MNAPLTASWRPAGRPWAALTASLVLASATAVHGAINLADWRQAQPLDIPAPGLIKVTLPAETLGALRRSAADLRVIDPTQAEIGWFLERPLHFTPDAPVRAAKSFSVTVRPRSTVVLVETGVTLPIGGLALETGDGSFLKAAAIEGMIEGSDWEPIATGVPLYHRYQGESRRQTAFEPHAWTRLRITLDDTQTEPIVVTGLRLLVVTSGPVAPLARQSVRIAARDESPGETRLTLDLGSANLDVASLLVTTDEGVFVRPASVRIRGVDRGEWVERPIARGLLYRDLAGTITTGTRAPLPRNVTRLEVGESVPAREVVLVIQNGDNPPLLISAVVAELQPVRLVFHARQAGRHQLLIGNPAVTAPWYDLAAFADQFKTATPGTGTLGALGPNPLFRLPAVVPDPYLLGATLDLAGWSRRKSIPITRSGAQVLELDPEVLSHAQPDLADLRLVSDGHQRPFVREPSPAWRTLTVEPVVDDDPQQPAMSRWKLKLPHAGLPIVSLAATSGATLFDRTVTLHESADDGRGDQRDRVLGEARWRRAPGEPVRALTLTLSIRPTTDTFWLEIHNQDNAPIPLAQVMLAYPAPRIRFLAPVSPATSLYYGNPKAHVPGYDLELVTGQLLVAETSTVTAEPEEKPKGGAWNRLALSGRGVWLFWGALAVVVVLLLGIMRRLLPAVPPPGP